MAEWPPKVGDRVVYANMFPGGGAPTFGSIGIIESIDERDRLYAVRYRSGKVCGLRGRHIWTTDLSSIRPVGTDVKKERKDKEQKEKEDRIKLHIGELESQREEIDAQIRELKKSLPEPEPVGPAIRHLDLDD